MQVHGPSETPDGISVRLNPGSGCPFAVLGFGSTEIYLQTVADCDELMKAAAMAKSLLPREADGFGWQQARTCEAARIGYGSCAREHIHPGWHRASSGVEWPQRTVDRDLDAILGGPAYRTPAIELPDGTGA